MNYLIKILLIATFSCFAHYSYAGCTQSYINSSNSLRIKADEMTIITADEAVAILFTLGVSAPPVSTTTGIRLTERSGLYSLAEDHSQIAQLISESYAGDGIEIRILFEKISGANKTATFEDVVKTVWSLDNSNAFCLNGKLLEKSVVEDLVLRASAAK